MLEFDKSFVVLEKDEFECLKKEASLYDPAPWCRLGICEGISKKCKDTCPDSIYTKIREEAIVDFLVSTGGWLPQEAAVLMRKFMIKTYGIKYDIKDLCGREAPEGLQICPTCEETLHSDIQNS